MAGTSNKSIPDMAIFGMVVSTRGLELFRCFMLFLSKGVRGLLFVNWLVDGELMA